MTDDLARAEASLRAVCGGRLRTGVPLAPLTSFRVGGPAALYLEPEDDADVLAAARAVRETGIDVVVLGKGSNVLVADDGFHGLVLRLGRGYRWAARDGDALTAGAAMPLPALAGVALRHGLEGLAFGVAIPGSVGGAVRMNAGAHGTEMANLLESVDVLRLGDMRGRTSVAADDISFAYRRSDLPADAVVLAARLRLRAGDRDAIRRAMDEARAWRRETQPVAEPNCGSVFKNPAGDHAARLIDAAGLKGLTVGTARVSDKHANFIVTVPPARAADVAALIATIQTRVEASAGVRLEPEVRFVGEVAT
ncbi:MAG TPA: UDP-N-acetylmuramate dehydrogenase [Actinomycetota bacterium]